MFIISMVPWRKLLLPVLARCRFQSLKARNLSFALTDDQKEFKRVARKFAQEEIIPRALQADRTGEFPQDIYEKAWKLGLVNMTLPQICGGMEHSILECVLVAEQIAYGCAGVANAFGANELAATPLKLGGSEELQKKYLGWMMAEPIMAAYSITEPDAGSDVAGLRTHAVKKGDEYILNGQKTFITSGSVASWYFVLARTDPSPRAAKGSAFTGFVVEKDWEGVSTGKTLDIMGQRCSNTAPLFFDDVRVPQENVVGAEGMGFRLALQTFDRTRPMVSVFGVGIAERALDEATKYSVQRKTMGKHICEHQMMQSMLADMAVGVEAARWLIYQAAWQADQNIKNTYIASIAKALAAEVAMKNAVDAVQVHGGSGYSRDCVVEKLMRDAKGLSIYGGTTQIQKVIISRDVIGRAMRGEL